MEPGDGYVLSPVEADSYTQAIEELNIKAIGSPKWFLQHERIEKLNMQAIQTAAAQENEFVKEFLINEFKIPVLIRELITIEVWKEKIFGELVAMHFEPRMTFPLYMALYHEATVVNLLETILYHEDACEAAGDMILDLIDYCYRKIVALMNRCPVYSKERTVTQKDLAGAGRSMTELQEQDAVLQFDISIKAISIVRYMTDHLAVLPLSATRRLLNTHDLPVLLVELLQVAPWERQSQNQGAAEKYIDNRWKEVPDEERFKVTKVEGQLWLGLYHLLMDPQCQQQYELNAYRKNVLLKLRSYLTEVLLDQLPVMAAVQVYLEHLSIMEPPAAKKDLILEQIPEYRDNLLLDNESKWASIAKKQAECFFNPDEEAIKSQAKRWADTYNFDALEGLISDPPKCTGCGDVAAKRCSRCQNEWYCGRECQVKHWPKHKKACDLLFETMGKVTAAAP